MKAPLRSLRVLITADPDLPVPPRFYGGIERIVDLLVTGLTSRGHDVTLVAHRDSTAGAALVPYPTLGAGVASTVRHAVVVTRAAMRVRPDVIHSFGRVAYLVPMLPWRVRKVMSYQRAVTPRTIRWATRLSRGSITWTACSRHIAAPVDHLGPWRVIYNAVPVDRLQFSASVAPDGPLVFLGRIEAVKGPHLAIRVARESGRRLLIAGNVPDDLQSRSYFREQIEPHVDGTSVVYCGPVDDQQKSRLLSEAAALLMPILWDEPFGIVMAEALACGTPVIGLARGSVPEVVDDGLTGFVCDTVEGMVAAVARLGEVSRQRCRDTAEARFSETTLVNEYESLYRRLVTDVAPAAAPEGETAGA